MKLEYQGKRKDILQGETHKIKTGCGNLYITVNFNDGKPFELFSILGKSGSCASCQLETTSRLVSALFRNGLGFEEGIRQLSGISCPAPIWSGGILIKSCSDAISIALRKMRVRTMIKKDAAGPYIIAEKDAVIWERKDNSLAKLDLKAENSLYHGYFKYRLATVNINDEFVVKDGDFTWDLKVESWNDRLGYTCSFGAVKVNPEVG